MPQPAILSSLGPLCLLKVQYLQDDRHVCYNVFLIP